MRAGLYNIRQEYPNFLDGYYVFPCIPARLAFASEPLKGTAQKPRKSSDAQRVKAEHEAVAKDWAEANKLADAAKDYRQNAGKNGEKSRERFYNSCSHIALMVGVGKASEEEAADCVFRHNRDAS